MNRIRSLILGTLIVALSIGCATTAPAPHRVGAVNNYTAPTCETLTLGVGTVHSSPRLTLSLDTWSAHIRNLTGTGSGAYTIEASNDGTNWFTVTLPTAPPALSSGTPTDIPIEYDGGWPHGWWRVTYVGTSGSGTSELCETFKG